MAALDHAHYVKPDHDAFALFEPRLLPWAWQFVFTHLIINLLPRRHRIALREPAHLWI